MIIFSSLFSIILCMLLLFIDCNIEYKKLIEELNQNLFTHKVCMCNLQQEIEQKNSELEAVRLTTLCFMFLIFMMLT